MAILAPFQPRFGAGIVVTPAAASASSEIGQGNKQLILTNIGSNICYVTIGYTGLVASTSGYPVLPGAQVTVSKDQDMTHIAYISASGTSLHIIPGEGW